MMELTSFKTYFPPALDLTGAINPPLSLARAPQGKPARVLVDNIGAVLIFLAGTEQDAQSPEGASSATFQLTAGASRVFVLAPGQVMFAIGAAAGGIVSVSISDAIPIGFERDKDGKMVPAATPGKGSTSVNPAWRRANAGKGTTGAE